MTDAIQTCETMSREWSPDPPLPTRLPTLSPTSNSDPSNLKLRIILAADSPGPNLCKTILSGYANGYPAPIIVNWGRNFTKDDGRLGHSHLGKIDGTLDVLEALLSDSTPADERLTEDDIVVFMDSYDVWFQLPPAMLIKRFHAQNALADARTRAAWMPNVNDTTSFEDLAPPEQSIIISAQKKCWPFRFDGKTIRCDAMPPSPVRPDLYGPMTDFGDVHVNRPRHVNSGSIIGTAGAMRRMFRRTLEKAIEGPVPLGWSDQAVFAEVMGEQEVWRKKVRKFNARSADGRFVQGGADQGLQAVLRGLGDEREEFEYGIGLDFYQELMPPTVYQETDGEFMLLNDTAALRTAGIAHGVFPARLQGLPEDMAGLDAPVRYTGLDDEAASMTVNATTHGDWANVPLYADYWTANVPVALHHNAHIDGMKTQRLRDWWKLTWFFPHLRQIAERAQAASNTTDPAARRQLAPLARIQGREAELVYWPPPADAEKPLTRIFDREQTGTKTLDEAGWDELCPAGGHKEWWEEVFEDGKGPIA